MGWVMIVLEVWYFKKEAINFISNNLSYSLYFSSSAAVNMRYFPILL
jgi:hypothetical protein